jgi:hypothetical protein
MLKLLTYNFVLQGKSGYSRRRENTEPALKNNKFFIIQFNKT